MKKINTLILLLVIIHGTLCTIAQVKSKFVENDAFPEKIEGYRKAKKSELGMPGQKMALNIMDIIAYNDKMEKIETNALMQKMMQGGVGMTPYVNEKMEVKILIISELPEEEKEQVSKETITKFSGKSKLLGNPMPDLTEIKDINDKVWTSEMLKNKVLVLNFWFKECKPCIMEIPELNTLVEKYGQKEVVFLAFGLDNKNDIFNFLEKHPFKYQMIAESEAIKNKFEVNGYPFHAIIDKKGIVQFTTTGLSGATLSMLESNIEKYLN